MQQTIDIALGFDRVYAPHAAATIASIVRHAPDAHFRFILLHPGLAEEIRTRIEAVAPGAVFHWAEVQIENLPRFSSHYSHLTRASLLRLCLESLAPEDCRRLIYLDSDTIVLDDISRLWVADLGGAPIGAVKDVYIDAAGFASAWSLPDGGAGGYFNSGVLLIDLDQVRSEHLFTEAAAFIARNGDRLTYGDQDALNAVFWGRWRSIDAAWNVQRPMTRSEIAAAGWGRKAPSIIHFITQDKPWIRNAWHHWAWVYWDNLRRTSFTREVTSAFHMDLYQMLRFRLRWLVKRPRLH